MPRRKIVEVLCSGWARQMRGDPGPMICIRVQAFDHNDIIIHDETRTISVRDMTLMLFGPDLPKPGDYIDVRRPSEEN